MTLWTTQGIAIYRQLQQAGSAWCTKPPACVDDSAFAIAYHWMAEQMRHRLGLPPIKDIEFPLWGWYQYNSAKDRKPPLSPHDIPKGESVFLEIDIPDHEVLLSDFSNWHAVLNLCPLVDWKRIFKKIERLDKEAGRILHFEEYPQNIRQEITCSWEAIFDLNRRDKDVGRKHKRNRSIQATFRVLRSEHIISVQFLKSDGKVVKVYDTM